MGYFLFKVTPDREPLYFKSKAAAKEARDESDRMCIVMRGPDHWRGESYGRPLNQTHSSKHGA